MRKSVILAIILVVSLIAVQGYADTTDKGIYSIPSSPAFEEYVNSQDRMTHRHEFDLHEEKSVQKVVGLDFVAYDNEVVEITNENRYNFETSITTLGAVCKVKKSLWSIGKNLLRK